MGPIEQKSAAATTTSFVIGYLAAVAVTAIPWLHDHLTPDQRQTLPAVVTAAFVAIVAYITPHTHRPDLVQPLEPVTGFVMRGGPDPVQPAPLPATETEQHWAKPAEPDWPQ